MIIPLGSNCTPLLKSRVGGLRASNAQTGACNRASEQAGVSCPGVLFATLRAQVRLCRAALSCV